MDDTLVMQLGHGQVRWSMPTTVQRLEVVSLWRTEGDAHAGAYALAAGLPRQVLRDLGLIGSPSQAMPRVIDAVLTRQGCTLMHAQQACASALAAVIRWYAEATQDKRGNSEPGPGGPAEEEASSFETVASES